MQEMTLDITFPDVHTTCSIISCLTSINLSPTYVLKQENWYKDTSQLPDIDVSTLKRYLINNMSEEFSSTSLRHYKLSRAYQHLDANHICNVSFNELKQSYNICVIKASCMPYQSGDEAKIKHCM